MTLSKKYIYSGHAKISYFTKGKGQPLILLHGNMSDSSYFNHQIDYFSKFYQVIAIDSRGHGHSTMGKKKLSLNLFVEDLLIVLDALKIDKCIMLGFSDGANIAMKFAKSYPERIIAMISVSANLSPEGLKLFFRIIVKLIIVLMKPLQRIKYFRHKRQVLSLINQTSRVSKKDLKKFKMPVLVISGAYDLIHRHHSQMIAKHIQLSKLIIVKKSGHNLLKSRRDKINPCILAFLNEFSKK